MSVKRSPKSATAAPPSACLLAASDNDCDVLTADPARYGRWVTTPRSSRSDRWARAVAATRWQRRYRGRLPSGVAPDRMRPVRLLQTTDLVVGQGHLQRPDGVFDVPDPGRPDDGCDHTRLVQQPGQRDSRRRQPAVGRHLLHGFHNRVIGLVVEPAGDLVGTRPCGLDRRPAGQQAPRQRAPRDQPDPEVQAERDHLPLLLPVGQVVVVLHRHETGPAMQPRGVLRLGELPRVHAGGADVAGLAGAHHVVQRLHGLLDRGARVEPVDLVQVHVVGTEPAQGAVDRAQDVLAGQPALVWARPHRREHLGGQHVVLALREQAGQQAPGNLLAHTAGVHVSGVEEHHALLGGLADNGLAGVLVEHPVAPRPVAVAHHAEADPRDLDPGGAQTRVLHQAASSWRSRWLITSVTPARMVTPYSASAISMVRFWWVMTISWLFSRSRSSSLSSRPRLTSSTPASTSSRM